jgi:7,8-dihydroneopterin aldolase/epimerase/oxygenase
MSQAQPGLIRINGMRFWGKHGALPQERESTQPIDVDLEVTADLAAASTSDSLNNTIDYAVLFELCQNIVTNQSFVLLEALARRIADQVCQDRRVLEVAVRVRKPRLLEGATPEVEFRRHCASS